MGRGGGRVGRGTVSCGDSKNKTRIKGGVSREKTQRSDSSLKRATWGGGGGVRRTGR